MQVLEVKRAKLEKLNRERAAECALARQQLNSKVEASQALASKLERIKKELQNVEVGCSKASELPSLGAGHVCRSAGA